MILVGPGAETPGGRTNGRCQGSARVKHQRRFVRASVFSLL